MAPFITINQDMVEERDGTRLERTGGLEQIFAKATSAFTDKVAEISTRGESSIPSLSSVHDK